MAVEPQLDYFRRLVRTYLIPRLVTLQVKEEGRKEVWKCELCGVETPYDHGRFHSAIRAKHTTHCDLSTAAEIVE